MTTLGIQLFVTGNPIKDAVALRWSAETPGNVQLVVYDMRGRVVRQLVDSGPNPGSVVWDGQDARGQRVSSGVYLVQLQSGSQRITRKITLMRE